jgi:recombination protein RecT
MAEQKTEQPEQTTAMVKTPFQKVRALFMGYEKELAKALPAHLDPQRFIRVALTTCSNNARLLDCTQQSLVLSLMRAAQLGLEPDGLLGQGYLIPRNNKRAGAMECQFQVGYQGWIALARRSKEVAAIVARVVHEKDTFKYTFGLKEDTLEHVPSDEVDAGPLTHAYCIVRMKEGEPLVTILSKATIEKNHRGRSMSKDDGPWVTDYEAMCLKTVITAGLKLAPKSVEVAKALVEEDLMDKGIDIEVAKASSTPVTVTPDSISAGEVTGTDNAKKPEPKTVEADVEAAAGLFT